MAANPEMGRLISEGMARAKARRLEAATQASRPAFEARPSPEHEVASRSRPSEGAYDAVNRAVIADMIRERRRVRHSSVYWCACMRDELGNALLDMTALLDQIPELSGEPLPHYGEQLRASLVAFMEVGFNNGFRRRAGSEA
jgi:hypothetical protein